jgi:hypothetical protein
LINKESLWHEILKKKLKNKTLAQVEKKEGLTLLVGVDGC